MATLCDHCKQIPFSRLSCPTASDILKARQAVKNNKKVSKGLPFCETPSDSDHRDLYIPLGSLRRIRKDKGFCGLCGLIYHVIQQRGDPRGMDNTQFLNDEDIAWFASITVFADVTESISDHSNNGCPDSHFHLRRLGLSMDFKNRTRLDGTILPEGEKSAVYRYVAQACHIDEFMHPHSSPEARVDGQRMLFGGRERPETVDMGLIRSWITLCETAHGVTCCFDEHPSESGQLHSGES